MKARVSPMTPGIPRAARLRAYLAGVVVSLGLTGVAWRAWGLQVGEGEHYRQLADKQHAVSVGIPAPRGEILDAQGRPLAVSADADSIWANPREIRDVTETAERLGGLIGADAVTLEAKLGRNQRFVWLGRHVAPEVAKAVKAAKLPGIEVSKEPRRWYPGKAVGGTVVGRSDIDGNGVDGIELSMNAQLVGHRGAGLALRDARGKKMFADGLARPEPGATVQLSIDGSLQAIAEAAVEESVRINKAKAGVAVVVEVGTGRVVAMASAPARDPNSNEASSARNHAVADSYEAGSVMKVFSIAAAMDDGLVTPTTEFDLGGGRLKLPGRATPITDVDKDPYLDVAGIIRRSSNVGAAKIALRFGSDKLYAAYKRFGFGARTGIELPGEQTGMLRNGAKWRDVELATMAYGYGLTVTPLQLAAALAAFGDGGMYREPRIVDRVTDPDGTLLYQAAPAARRVVSEKTAAQMKTMLAGVFEGGKLAGTAAKIVVPGFRCGGKTGTAHKYDPEIRKYSLEHYLSTFAGLAPIDHPRLAIVVLVDDPVGGDYFGAKVAGPVFARIASEGLRYLGVPGTSAICPPPVPGALPSIEPRTCLPGPPVAKPAKPLVAANGAAAPGANGGAAPGAANGAAGASGPGAIAVARANGAAGASGPGATVVARANGAAAASGAGTVAGSGAGAPGAVNAVANGEGPRERFAEDVPPVSVALDPNADERDRPSAPVVRVPDLRGMGMAKAIATARAAHLGIAISGTGRVVAQDPAPGAAGATRVTLRFSDGNLMTAAATAAAP